ncbi:MAG: hypothetical protein WA952_04285 [Lewinella sp.]
MALKIDKTKKAPGKIDKADNHGKVTAPNAKGGSRKNGTKAGGTKKSGKK